MAHLLDQSILGAPVKRREDPELLQGAAKFTADLSLPGMLHMAILHSPHPHAVIKSIDTSAALQAPGVVRVFTGADVADKMMRMPVIWKPGGVESHFPPHPYGLPGGQMALATDRARYVGEWVALVIAETREQAYAALPLVQVEYEPLPFVVDAEEALKDGAPQLHAEAPNNLCVHFPIGDKEAAEQAVAGAEVVVRQTIDIPRQVHNAVETRASMAKYDAETGEYTLWTNTQIPAANHYAIAKIRLFTAHWRLCRSYKGVEFEKCTFVEKYVDTFACCQFSFQMLTVCRIVFHFLQSLQSLPEYFVFIHYWFLKFY